MDDAHLTFQSLFCGKSEKQIGGLLPLDLLLSFNRAPLILLLFWSQEHGLVALHLNKPSLLPWRPLASGKAQCDSYLRLNWYHWALWQTGWSIHVTSVALMLIRFHLHWMKGPSDLRVNVPRTSDNMFISLYICFRDFFIVLLLLMLFQIEKAFKSPITSNSEKEKL